MHFRFNPHKLLTRTHGCIPVYTGASCNHFLFTQLEHPALSRFSMQHKVARPGFELRPLSPYPKAINLKPRVHPPINTFVLLFKYKWRAFCSLRSYSSKERKLTNILMLLPQRNSIPFVHSKMFLYFCWKAFAQNGTIDWIWCFVYRVACLIKNCVLLCFTYRLRNRRFFFVMCESMHTWKVSNCLLDSEKYQSID